MKAVISNRIFLNCDKGSELERTLSKVLTYEISQMPVSHYPLIIRNMTRVTDKVVSIPAGCKRYIPEDYEIVDKSVDAPVEFPPLLATLRPSQQEAVDTIESTGLVNAPVSFGKSLVGMGLAVKFQQKTLIVCTTTTIRDMWISEIEKHMGIKPGIIGSGKMKLEPPIVVGNIQTIRNRIKEIQDVFGLVILDEVHRAPAATFTDFLNSMRAKYRVGLSGTLERKDGLHVVLEDYFGTTKFIGKVENSLPPTIHTYNTGIELNSNEFIPWSLLMTKLMSSQVYKHQIETLTRAYIEAGHKVLILADRTEFLEDLHTRLIDQSFLVTGKITGAETRQKIFDAVVDFKGGVGLFGTQSIFSEGVSINPLSCVILATPINNEPLLRQIIGRVQRMCEGKLDPIVVDLIFDGNTGTKHFNSRRKTYMSFGWNVKHMGAA